MSEASSNPFISRKKGPLETIPFDLIKLEHFIPGLKEGIKQGHENIKKIKAEKKPNFENIIFAMENISNLLDEVSSVYFNLHSSEATPELAELAPEISALCSNFSSDIFLDEDLFKQVKSVYDNQDKANLTSEQKVLLKNTYKAFTRNGALLDKDKKEQLRKVDEELSQLSPKFADNVLKATNAFEYRVDREDQLIGLPEYAKTAAKELAHEKGYEKGWIFNLQAPSYIPFMQYSQDRSAREKIWKAYGARCYKDSFSNEEVIQKIVELKLKRSQILGYKTYSDYVLEERMAQSAERVLGFLDNLIQVSKPAAQKDLDELKAFAKEKDNLSDFKPWDFAYYSEALKKEKYDFDEQLLKPYFPLDQAIEGVFKVASELYQIKFISNQKISTYHPDVRVFEVHDENSKNLIGLFYCDFFPRTTKKGGAWMTDFRKQGLNEKKEMEAPHVSIVCNFTKPTKDHPSLLTFDEVNTLFHEFGHSLHGLLSQCTYKSLAGTSVYWDFVELPSQFMENFLLEKEVLDMFAAHYETGEKIPQEMIDKLKRANKFQAGWVSLRQLNFAKLDMSWHSLKEYKKTEVRAFELEHTKGTTLTEPIEGNCMSCSFSHIFGGGYASGYYSYKWAEVLDADAFEFFKEKGLFGSEASKKFRENILSRGGTEHPSELYRKFRGHDPDLNALLRRDGLI